VAQHFDREHGQIGLHREVGCPSWGHATRPGMSDIQYKVPLNTNTNINININTNTPRSTLCAYLNSEREIPGPTSGDQQRRKQAAPRAD
jgi:hypothetical protein